MQGMKHFSDCHNQIYGESKIFEKKNGFSKIQHFSHFWGFFGIFGDFYQNTGDSFA